ncbi:MAG: hypothetical protein HOM86_26450, partial [Gemmatimonadetes bacterium]|nr:hypothetical protein [Gemmatimonadota bacterium]
MMKGSKYLLLLATFMVGFGLVGAADAATVKSIAVTSPDSGAIKGIDSTFVITAKVLDLSPVDSLEVVMYLTTSSDSIVVADNTNSAVTFGALNQMTVINIARNRAILATPTTKLVDGQSGTTLSAANAAGFGSLVAVQQKRARGVASSASALGDADSVTVVVAEDTTTFVWYGKVDASSGTVSGVRAAIFVIDSANGGTTFGDTSNVSVSATSGQFNIDADRPAGPNKLGTAGGDGFIAIVANATDQSAVVSGQARDL